MSICGPSIQPVFKEVRQEAGREVIVLKLHFSKRLAPATLLALTPAETRWLSVPFELRDLAMR